MHCPCRDLTAFCDFAVCDVRAYSLAKSTCMQGLAIAMFMCAIAANVLYGGGILIRAYSWDVVVASAPWILGSLGTVGLDVVIFLQVWPRSLATPVLACNGMVVACSSSLPGTCKADCCSCQRMLVAQSA